MLANLEKLDTELRHREAEVAVREDEVLKRERAVMIEEEKNKDTAAELKDIETTLEERARQGWAQSWDEQQWQKEKELVVREDAVAERERTATEREDDLRERALEIDRDAEDVEKKYNDFKALEKLLSARMDQETLLRFLGGATKEFVRKARTRTHTHTHICYYTHMI